MKKLAGGLAALLIVFAVSMIAQPKKSAGGDEAALKAIEEKWEVASVKADIATLGAILADTFVSTNADGHVQTKAEMLAALKSGEVKFEKSDVDELKVQVYGSAAIIMGRWSGKVIEKGTAGRIRRALHRHLHQAGRPVEVRCVALFADSLTRRPLPPEGGRAVISGDDRLPKLLLQSYGMTLRPLRQLLD